MPRPGGKATISLKGNAKNLPDIYFRELVQLYSRDCRTRGIEEVTIAGYEYACKKFLEYLQEDIRCSDLRQELFDDYQMELATRVKAETVNSYLFKISPVLKFGKERGTSPPTFSCRTWPIRSISRKFIPRTRSGNCWPAPRRISSTNTVPGSLSACFWVRASAPLNCGLSAARM